VARYDLPRAADGPLRLVQLFVNSIDREHGPDWLPSADSLAAWLDERGLEFDGKLTERDLDRAHELREAFRSLLRANNGGVADSHAASVVNEAARRGGLELALDDAGAIRIAARGEGVDAALARVIAVAFAAMLDGSWTRLKACRQCTWAFWDTSKNRSGSWCSMQLCGNRMKTRAYRRRKSAGGRS
jgi:predicted RNA-binding Zn ribbon-like protein